MVRDYVTTLYQPATHSSREVLADGAAERGLASYVTRVQRAWPTVAVEHVDAAGIGDAPERGDHFTVRAHVSLGELVPADVLVQLVAGRVDHNDRLVDPRAVPLEAVESTVRPAGATRPGALDHTGPFGYTVRVVPHHGGLVSVAELGLQALPVSG